jgi:hypothetical protein
VSFSNHARRVRDRSLPYAWRVSALRSCVQHYRPIGFLASLSYLEATAGPFERDEEALLRALDALVRSRAARRVEEKRYADRRRTEKRAGRRVPRPGDVTPSSIHGHWYGAPRGAAVHALGHWLTPRRRGPSRLDELQIGPADPAALRLASLVVACEESGGKLTDEQHRQLAECTAAFAARTADVEFDRMRQLRWVAKLLATASDSSATDLTFRSAAASTGYDDDAD